MNHSLLNLNPTATTAGAVVMAGNPTESTTEAGTGDAKAFAQLLEQAADEQLLPGLSAETNAAEADAANDEQNADEMAATSEATELVTESGTEELVLSATMPAPVVTQATPTAPESPVTAALFGTAVPAELSPTGAPTVATGAAADEIALPLSGNALPGWQRLLANELAGKAGQSADTAVTDVDQNGSASLSDPVETAWSSLLKAAAEAPAAGVREQTLASTRNRLEPLPVLAPLISQGESTNSSSASLDKVPGIAVQSPHFANLVGNQVLWQAKLGNSQAEIRLDPPDLGPIEVRISQKDSETHLHFVVSHQTTREQLEQALPRLRELFGQGGLQLGQVAVEQGKQDSGSDGTPQRQGGRSAGAEQVAVTEEPLKGRTSISLIDDYA